MHNKFKEIGEGPDDSSANVFSGARFNSMLLNGMTFEPNIFSLDNQDIIVKLRNYEIIHFQYLTRGDERFIPIVKAICFERKLKYLGIAAWALNPLAQSKTKIITEKLFITDSVSLGKDFANIFDLVTLDRLVAMKCRIKLDLLPKLNPKRLEVEVNDYDEFFTAVNALNDLQVLGVSAKVSNDFKKLQCASLRFLRVLGGRADKLNNMDLPLLTDLYLHSLAVTSLGFLEGLPNLEEITFLYCPKINDWEILLRMSKLRKICVFGCRPPKGKLRSLLNEKGIEVTDFT